VTVTNGFDLPVNIVLRATPSNGRLEVDSDTAKTIPAKASAKVLVPVKAKLGNGSVRLGLQLYSPTELPIGAPQTASIEVHADWEGLGALILGIAVVLFFGFGLTRSILRRIRARRDGTDPAAGEPGASSDDDESPDDLSAPSPSGPQAEQTEQAEPTEQAKPAEKKEHADNAERTADAGGPEGSTHG
jgi:hypothetical protein